LIYSFLGGWVAGAIGLGGGSIFNPLLLKLNVPPRVSSSTSMYLVTFSNISACLIYFLIGKINYSYALWMSLASTIGSILALWIANIYIKKLNRQSILVFFLSFVLFISFLGVPIFSGIDIIKINDEGKNIWKFNSFC
jgi:uncharacterized membrane protein YfcA